MDSLQFFVFEGIFDFIFNIGLTTRIDAGLKMFVGFNDAHNATGSILSVLCIISYCLYTHNVNRRYYFASFIILFIGLLLTKSEEYSSIIFKYYFKNFIDNDNFKNVLNKY